MNAVFQELGPCACGEPACEQIGTKLSKALDEETAPHLVGCSCIRHRNRRNQRKGKSAQAKVHKALGGIGPTPHHEESHNGYSIVVQVESKKGYPGKTVKLYDFLGTEFFRRALDQAERSRRIGDGSMPAVAIDDKWLIVQINRGMDGVA